MSRVNGTKTPVRPSKVREASEEVKAAVRDAIPEIVKAVRAELDPPAEPVIEAPEPGIEGNLDWAKLVGLGIVTKQAAEAYGDGTLAEAVAPKAEEDETGVWHLYGPIMPQPMFDLGGDLPITTVQSLRDVLDAMDDGDDVLQMRVHSPGGVVIEASAMITLLEEFKANGGRVEAVVEGMAASAAAIVAATADEVSIGKQASFMIHRSTGVLSGNANDFRAAAERLDSADGQAIEILSARMSESEDELGELLDAETWYRGQEAVDAGLADRLVGEKEKTDGEMKVDPDEHRAAGASSVIRKRSVETLNVFLTEGV